MVSTGINYEVFLSFRGKDTCTGFMDLHKVLKNEGIKVFKDNEKLCAGEEINQGLTDAMKQSRILIPIFSKDYASSESCLMELLQMWECRKSDGQTILPIFYGVSPYDVTHQAGDFAMSFKKHEKNGKVDANTINLWKEVLQLVGKLSGIYWENINGRHPSDLPEKVLTRVRQVLKNDDQLVTDEPDGIDLHVQEMMRKLGVVYSDGQVIELRGEDVRVVGIGGMWGVGKTILAKVVFDKIHKLFDGCSFLEGIKSEEVKFSQELLIADLQNEKCASLKSSDEGIKIIENQFSNMKALIVLDDVHEIEQIEALVGKLSWFGSGSRIIVTTDRRNVLDGFNDEAVWVAVKEHKGEPLSNDHARQLFHTHAFRGDDALQDVPEYDSLSTDIVGALGGHPFAIVLWAGYLRHNRKINIWRETSDLLKKNRGDRVEQKVEAAFKASYDSLNDCTKKIFLDIVSFFIGKDWRFAYRMWGTCDYDPAGELELLREMNLLEIGENNELRMHNLLRDFGRKLVKGKDLHERSRFWNPSHSLCILRDSKGTENAEGIGLTVEEGCAFCFTGEEFHKMSNLRHLRLERANIQGTAENLLPNLRWFEWPACPSISKLGNMHLNKLVILDLSQSPVTGDSQVWRQIMEKAEELKVLNLQGCVQLPALLNFPAPIKLEILILEDCTQLSQIGPFISNLRNLSSLNLRKCSRIKQLPKELGRMKSLKELLIDGTGIQRIHFQEGSLENLEILSARGCEELKGISTIARLRNLTSLALDGSANIDWDPETSEFPQKLQTVSLRNCQTFNELPQSVGELTQLEVMDLSGTGIKEMPPSVKNLSNLKTLKMKGTHLQNFPEEIMKLKKLAEIDFSRCRSLGGQVPFDILGLSSLRILRLSSTEVAGLPNCICCLSCLQTLDLIKCNQLQAVPQLPSSLLSLRWRSKNMTVPDLSYLTTLKELCLNADEQPEAGSSSQTLNIEWITRLTSLETLELSLPNITNLPGNFSALTRLRELTLSYMKELDLTLPSSPSLWTLRLKHCKIQEPKFSSLKYLSELELEDCHLAKIDGLEDLKLLRILKISQCNSIKDLNGLKELGGLRQVRVFPFDPASLSDLSQCTFELDACVQATPESGVLLGPGENIRYPKRTTSSLS